MSAAEFRVRYDEQYLLSAISRHRRQLWWRGAYDLLRWSLAAVMALLTGIVFYSGAFMPSVVLGGFTGALLGSILLGDPIDAWILKRRLRKSPFHNNNLVFRVSPTDIHASGNNEDTHLKWTAYSKARRFSDGLLLYQGPQFFNWLPDSAALDAASISAAQEMARSYVKDYRDV